MEKKVSWIVKGYGKYGRKASWKMKRLLGLLLTIFSFMCMFCRSSFVLCTFSFGHCVICSSSIYGFWLPLWLSSNSSSHPVFGGVRVAHLFSFPALWCAQCWQCFLIALSGFHNVSLITFFDLREYKYQKCHLYTCTSISCKMFNIYLLLTI